MTGWTAVVTALSVAIIALAVIAVALGIGRVLLEVKRLADRFDHMLDGFEREARPIIEAARTAASEGTRLVQRVRAEADKLADTAGDLRERVVAAADRMETRFEDFEALADLMQEEIEDTALDVAAALRTTRRGSGLLRSMKRAFTRGR